MLQLHRRFLLQVMRMITVLLVSRTASAQNLPSDTPHAEAMRQHPIEAYHHAQDELPAFDPSQQPDHVMGAPFNVVYGWFP